MLNAYFCGQKYYFISHDLYTIKTVFVGMGYTVFMLSIRVGVGR